MTAIETAFGSMNYNLLRSLIEEGQVLRLNRGVEVGVLMANTSEYLLKSFPSLTLLCVDPYLPYAEGDAPREAEAMEFYEKVAHARLDPFGSRAAMFKATSLEVAKELKDEILDFVFIDANHEYDKVREDLNAWYSKIRPGGLFAGHDYRWDGVRKAVDEFCNQKDFKAWVSAQSSDVWFFYKESADPSMLPPKQHFEDLKAMSNSK